VLVCLPSADFETSNYGGYGSFCDLFMSYTIVTVQQSSQYRTGAWVRATPHPSKIAAPRQVCCTQSVEVE